MPMIRALLATVLLLLTLPVKAEIPKIDLTRGVYIEGQIGTNDILQLGVRLLTLSTAAPAKPVSVVINSPGGSVVLGYLFVDYIEQVKAQGTRVNCYVQQLAASMAFQILAHCDGRYAPDNALLLWHPAAVVGAGALNAEAAQQVADELKVVNDFILRDLAEHLKGISKEDLLKHFNRQTLHRATDLERLTNGQFITVVKAIPGLLNITRETLPSGGGGLIRVRGGIYYIYDPASPQ